MARQDVFAGCRTGVAQVYLEQNREPITAGSAFLVPGGLVTNSHVLRDADFDVAVFRFEDMDYNNGVRLARDTCLAATVHESPRDAHDVTFLRLAEPEFTGRHIFTFGDSARLSVGDEVGFLGYPFQLTQLTCHVGYVSSLHRRERVDVIQIDGSINGGNSGGPVIELAEGRVVGLIARAEVGFLVDQFDELIRTLRQNVELLEGHQGGVLIGGVDPVGGLRASQSAMLQIAANMRRSANVGIGYAFSTNYIRDRLAE